MGFANVAQSSGSFQRAASEYNLLNRENQNRMRVDNAISVARGQQLSAKAGETAETTQQYVDKFFQNASAESAVTASKWGFWASLANAVTSVTSSAVGGKSGIDTAIAAVSGGFGALTALFAWIGAAEEAKLVNKQFGDVSEATQQDQKSLKSLDSNPTL